MLFVAYFFPICTAVPCPGSALPSTELALGSASKQVCEESQRLPLACSFPYYWAGLSISKFPVFLDTRFRNLRHLLPPWPICRCSSRKVNANERSFVPKWQYGEPLRRLQLFQTVKIDEFCLAFLGWLSQFPVFIVSRFWAESTGQCVCVCVCVSVVCA